jgi:hypothetical protein
MNLIIDKSLKNKIEELPREIQKKIYIYSWKKFWQNYTPLTAKIPSWQNRHNMIQKELWESRLKNIHFLHLSFNTLPENKKWIMGCQCDFCLNDTKVSYIEKHCHYLVQYRNNSYFPDKFMPCETCGYWNETLIFYWKSFNDYIKIIGKNFDPLCGSYKENQFSKKLREGYQFTFN